jgi:hypothetical protein
VRCGRCSEVFNAAESLVDIDPGAQRSTAEPTPPAPAPAALSADIDFELDTDQPYAEPDSRAAAAEPPETDQADPPLRAQAEPAPTSAPGATAAASDAADPRAEPDDRPSFVRNAERAQRWRQPRVRTALGAVAVLAIAGLGGQISYEYRDLMAARFPATRPALELACKAIGCTVEAAHAIDSLAVESSGLVRVEKSSIYKLSVGLRNRAGIEVALPALDLTLTDTQGRLVARKVLRMADFGTPQATLGAGRDLTLQTTLQAAAQAGEPPPQAIVGYTIEVFYP